MSTVTLHETFTIDDVLTNVTSVKLSDPTATFGVKRNDTGAIVVADNTAMTNTATGTYEHTFTEPAAGLTYTYWVEWVYGGETFRDEKTVVGYTITGIVTLAEAKGHLRIITTTDDEYIARLILACTKAAEQFQNRTYLQQTRVMKFDRFPDIIRPLYPPLISVDSIQYVDTAGTTQTLTPATTYYTVDTTLEPGRIIPAYGLTWPSTRDHINSVTLTYQAGYGAAANVPSEIKWAVLLLIGHLFEHRESASEINISEVPLAYKMILWADRVF